MRFILSEERQMEHLNHEQTWKQATNDYKSLHKLIKNSTSIGSFAFKCQDVIINKSTVDEEYYQSAKRFLLIINLLGIYTEIRLLIIDDLKKIPNFHLSYHSLSPEEQKNMVSQVKSIQKWTSYCGININLAFLLELSGYIFTKQFKYNSHVLYQLYRKGEKNRQRRVEFLGLEQQQYQQQQQKQHADKDKNYHT